MQALRIYHSGVVGAWRERDRELRRLGIDVHLVSARQWNEGGADVSLDMGDDAFAEPAQTFGRHPYRFVYDPRPIWRSVRRLRPDVIDCHEEPASLAALEVLLVRRLAGSQAPILFYGAQNIEKRFPPPFRWIERWALRSAAGVYCCNAEAGEIFRRKGFRGTVSVMGLGVDLDRFVPGESPPSGGEIRIGYVGRLEWRKGVHVLIEALVALPERFELHVYGTGPDESRLRQHAAVHGVGKRVHFHGFTDQADLPAVYRSVHMIGVPSLTTRRWVEQFGRVAVEAMACGVPVLTSDSGSLPEVVGDAGMVLPEADVDAWGLAFAALADDSAQLDGLRTAGPERVQRYTWQAVARAHRDLYEQVTS